MWITPAATMILASHRLEDEAVAAEDGHQQEADVAAHQPAADAEEDEDAETRPNKK